MESPFYTIIIFFPTTSFQQLLPWNPYNWVASTPFSSHLQLSYCLHFHLHLFFPSFALILICTPPFLLLTTPLLTTPLLSLSQISSKFIHCRNLQTSWVITCISVLIWVLDSAIALIGSLYLFLCYPQPLHLHHLLAYTCYWERKKKTSQSFTINKTFQEC